MNKQKRNLSSDENYALSPNILSQIAEKLYSSDGLKPLFFLDYDGVLSPIVNDPEKSFLPAETRETIVQLSKSFPVTIVTGRSNEKIKQFLNLENEEDFHSQNIILATSHGQEIQVPRNFSETGGFSVGENVYEQLQRVKVDLNQILDSFHVSSEKLWIEDNKFALSVHYRFREEKEIQSLEVEIENYVSLYNEKNIDLSGSDVFIRSGEEMSKKYCLVKGTGKNLFEVRAQTNFHKGKAIDWVMNFLKYKGKNYFPVVLGDDVTDEDGFLEVLEFNDSVSVLVCEKEELEHRKTYAKYFIRNPIEVNIFLQSFLPKLQQKQNM
eukprot:snap_masked-scaffold_10-processed-gene-13.32-mRNA-1 protein AED:1.00 eAED:1.00 QI:0/-1/0/0/-1/1/1/0/323